MTLVSRFRRAPPTTTSSPGVTAEATPAPVCPTVGRAATKQVYGNLPFTDAESFNISAGASITRHLSGTATFNPPSLANGATTSVNVSVPGAAPGDTVVANFDQFTDANWAITGFVRAGGSVRVIIQNLTGGTVDLPEGTVRADVWKH